MKIPTSSRPENKSRNEDPLQHNKEYHSQHHNQFPTDRDLIRPAAFVFVCGALVLAIVAIILLVMG